MAQVPVDQTAANLRHAFLWETLASRRYHRVAASAEANADQRAAHELRRLAERWDSHAAEHLRLLSGLENDASGCSTGNVRDDLRAAIAGEREQHAVYAGMARTARDEGLDEIADWFETLAKAGRSHARRFQRALDTLLDQRSRGFGT
jgi:rubrerythrin